MESPRSAACKGKGQISTNSRGGGPRILRILLAGCGDAVDDRSHWRTAHRSGEAVVRRTGRRGSHEEEEVRSHHQQVAHGCEEGCGTGREHSSRHDEEESGGVRTGHSQHHEEVVGDVRSNRQRHHKLHRSHDETETESGHGEGTSEMAAPRLAPGQTVSADDGKSDLPHLHQQCS